MTLAADHQAFEDAFNLHGSALLSFAVRRLDGLAAAEDAVSEAFLAAWRGWAKRPVDVSQTLPWLYCFAGNAVRDQRRSAERRRRLSAKASMYTVEEVVPDGAGAVVGLQFVAQALAGMSPGDQEILRLLAWEKVATSHELALALNITPAAARVRLHRARRRLDERLHADGAGHGVTALVPELPAFPHTPLSAGA